MFEHGLFRSEDVVEPLFPEHVTARLEDKTIALNLINDFHGVAGWNFLAEVIFCRGDKNLRQNTRGRLIHF